MASISSVLSLGMGSWSNVNLDLTMGFGIGTPLAVTYPVFTATFTLDNLFSDTDDMSNTLTSTSVVM